MSQVTPFKFNLETRELKILDQTLLPSTVQYCDVPDSEVGHHVIKSMKVRGAPCIAAVGCLSLIAELNQPGFSLENVDELIEYIERKSDRLIDARPTAVNLKNALEKLNMECKVSGRELGTCNLIDRLTSLSIYAMDGGRVQNVRLGDFGAQKLMQISGGDDTRKQLVVLTHCNTGSLATVGYGTALGVIRSLHNAGRLKRAYCTETRPYNQGSRLTAWELVEENIPAILIADNMVACLMAGKNGDRVDAVVVGADCVASNGYTANKIGTYQIAVVAKHFGVPFFVAAPTQSIDLTKIDEKLIEVESRPADELRRVGEVQLAPNDVEVWNPCFDITPSELITGIITELGVCDPLDLVNFLDSKSTRESQGTFFF